jgi:hypothetical protein
MKEFIEILKNNPNEAYDYISNNYYKMSKDELRDIAKELLFAIYDNVINTEEHDKIMNNVAEELENYYSED